MLRLSVVRLCEDQSHFFRMISFILDADLGVGIAAATAGIPTQFPNRNFALCSTPRAKSNISTQSYNLGESQTMTGNQFQDIFSVMTKTTVQVGRSFPASVLWTDLFRQVT